jgi:hypothetical protein
MRIFIEMEWLSNISAYGWTQPDDNHISLSIELLSGSVIRSSSQWSDTGIWQSLFR